MSIPDQDHIENAILWMSYADEDHAQQCAEKYLKAYMVYHDTDFPYTHDIQKLLNLCGNHKWIEKIKDAEELTPYAISGYPGMDEAVTEDGMTIEEAASS